MGRRRKKTSNQKPILLIGLASVAVVALLAVVYFASTHTAASSDIGSEVSPTKAWSLMQEGAFLLDVREPDEYSQGHVPGSVLIPLGSLPSHLGGLPPDTLILTICRTGNRSDQARDLLQQYGFSQVASVQGGMQAWVIAGLPTE
jgi:rhodanese-related sulfurtransferase